MLLPIAKVQIIGIRPHQDKTVRLLQRLGVIQVETWSESRSLSQRRMALDAEALHLRERLAFAATRVDAVLAALPPLELTPAAAYEAYFGHPSGWLLQAAEADLAEVVPQAQALVTQRNQLDEQLGSLARYQATLRQLLPVTPIMIDLEQYAVTAIWVERRYQPVLAALARQLEALTQGLCEVMSREVGQELVAAVLVFPKHQTKEVNELLGQENISQVRLPPDLAGQSLQQALTHIQQRLEAIPRELAELEAQQQTLAQAWRPRLLSWQALLRDHLAQLEIRSHFGQTDYTFVIEGWIPESKLAELETTLQQEVGDELVVVVLPLSTAEQKLTPVLFDNPRLVQPFEPLVGLLALPRYGDFDPTPLMAIFFPLFFGMILGDVAYGLILLALMLYLRRRFRARPTVRLLTEALSLGALWGIVFGFLFGEFFGPLGEEIGLHPLWFERGHNVQALFLLTIGLGAGHMVLGLCLGLWDGLRRQSGHEVIEKAAMLVALAAIFLLVAVLADYLPDSFFTPAIALLVVGVVILSYSLGKLGLLLGPLELLGTVGNILSYLRIAAIGLSSVYLAQVANELAGLVGNLLVGLIIAALFHALNLVLGTFSPTIQSLRLHYVEFFGKFYKGGGQPFRPFQRLK
jgi:V/A-type H+-transporting ATPase subunit I